VTTPVWFVAIVGLPGAFAVAVKVKTPGGFPAIVNV